MTYQFFLFFLSPVNAFFLYSKYKQIPIVEKQVINGNVNFASSSEDRFVASRSLHVWNKLNRCHAFVPKHTVICLWKSMQCLYCKFSCFSSSLFFLLLRNVNRTLQIIFFWKLISIVRNYGVDSSSSCSKTNPGTPLFIFKLRFPQYEQSIDKF